MTPSNNLENKPFSDRYFMQESSGSQEILEYSLDQMPLMNQGLLCPF